jgi:DNA-binding CsgD family transcriptional regulator/tetratricopeptide (TPR) repeat protein
MSARRQIGEPTQVALPAPYIGQSGAQAPPIIVSYENRYTCPAGMTVMSPALRRDSSSSILRRTAPEHSALRQTVNEATNLLERQPQLEALARNLREAGTSAGKIAFVGGEAGAGKSALVEQFAQQAAGVGRVLWGHCDALPTSRVLGPVNEVIAGMPLLPGVSRESGLPREELFSRLFERLSPPNPVSIVILEDLHWADEATLDFVRFLGRRIQRTRCLLIATYRDDELAPTHLLRGVLGEVTGQHTARIPVSALSFSAVEQLTQGTRRTAQQVYQVTGGNPFFVRELLSAPTDAVPQTVRDAVLARLMQCSPTAREVAELVSLLPGRTELWLIRKLLGDIGGAADEAVERGLLRYHDETLAFRHELGRLAVESTIPRSRPQALHQSILQSLIERDADLSQLVHHASLAQDVKALIEYAPRAAQQAARAGAHREAAAHLATALRYVDSLIAPERARLFELHAIECDITNQVAASLDSGTRGLALWRDLGDVAAQARVLLLLGRARWKSGQTELADRHVSEAIALLETLPQSQNLAMAYSVRSQLAMTSERTEESLEFGQRALDLAAKFGDHGVRAHALNNIGTAVLASGDEAGLVQLEKSLAIALEHNLQEHAGRAYANLVSGSVRQHLSDPARHYILEGIEYCEVHEVQDCLSYIRAYGAHFDLNNGQWDTAVHVAMELIEHHALAISQRIPAMVVLAVVRARRGDPGVDLLLDEAMQLALATGESQRIGPVAATRAEAAWCRGDLKRVTEETGIGLQAAPEHRDPWIKGELTYWAHRADPRIEATADIAEPYALMIAGDWVGAAAAWQQLGAPYERALALADGPEEALLESLAVLEQLGAGPLATIVRQRLRERGVRGIPRGPRVSTRENPAGLTSREVQVLSLLVHGHTNADLARRLHISAKTVDHHVSSILQKLEVRSRTEAVSAAFELGIVNAAR